MATITIKQAAALAGVHYETVRVWCDKGAGFKPQLVKDPKKTRPHWEIDRTIFKHWLKHDRATFCNPRKKNNKAHRNYAKYDSMNEQQHADRFAVVMACKAIYLPGASGSAKVWKWEKPPPAA